MACRPIWRAARRNICGSQAMARNVLVDAGFIVALLSGGLLATFALTMTVALGVKAPLDFSVFSAAAGALLLGVHADVPFSVDEALRRNRQEK